MGSKGIYISRIQRRMFFLSFVTAFAAVFTQTLAVLIDNVIVCTFYGETEIAAVALAGPFFYLLEIPAAGLAMGIQTVCARDLGAGRIDRVSRQFNQIFFFSAAVLAVLTVLVFLTVPQLAFLFDARGNTAVLKPYATQYLYGLAFEILPYVLFCLATPVVILDNGGRLITIASVCGCLTDIVLDLLSVRFGWGLFGIGIASSASAVVYFLIAMLHFLSRDRVIHLSIVRTCISDLREIFVSSAPKALRSLADALRAVLFLSLISATGGMIGTFVLTIHDTVSYMLLIVSQGIAGAVGIMAGICHGEKNGEELEGVGALADRYNVVVSVCVIAVLTAGARPLASLLAESAESAELLAFAVICIAASAPFTIWVNVRISYLQAVGHVRKAQWMGIAADLILLVIAACLLAVPFGVRGVFLAFPVSKAGAMAVSWAIHAWRAKKALPSRSDFLEVEESFFTGPGDVISYPVRDKEDCALASQQVMLFCRGHGLDEEKGFLAGLCVEELTVNAVEHGGGRGQADAASDLRVLIDGEDVIIRLRSFGPAFNLRQFADRLEERGPGTGPGVRILLDAAKDVSYYRTYGTNTTIIRV